ncbi:MAG: extracellular solute-binding protein [Chloroflexi bacterium]|nr:extracellular solute-binding protein [Chloroflexota bacterium]
MRIRASVILMLMIALTLTLAACAASAPEPTAPPAEPTQAPAESGLEVESGDLVVYSYEETVTDDFLNGYREQYPQVNLKPAVFGELDEALAKLRGGFKADVFNPCVDYIPTLTKLDLLEPVDTSKIERWDDLFPFFRQLPEIQAGEGKVWMVPVDAGLEGIMYRTDKIDPPPTSWNDLWNEEYAGHIAMEDYARNAIAIAALALGYEDPFNLTPEQLEAAKQKLIEQKPLLLTYFESDSEIRELFKSGDVWISFGWTADANILSDEEGIPVEYVSPKEGALSWICGYSILKGTEMPNAAHALLNHYLDPELQYIEATDFEYFVANQKVLDMLSEEEIALVGLDNPAEVQNAHAEVTPLNYDEWLQAWEEVLAQ